MMTHTHHTAQPETPQPVITRNPLTHPLLRTVDSGTVLRHPHRSEPHAWRYTINGDGDGTLATHTTLAHFCEAGLIDWWPFHGPLAPQNAYRAYTTPLGDHTLHDWDVDAGIIRPTDNTGDSAGSGGCAA